MMRYWELQIGDWVLYNGTHVKVTSITKKKIGYHKKENETRLYYARLVDVYPIPIYDAFLQHNLDKDGKDYTSAQAYWTKLPPSSEDKNEGMVGISKYPDGYYLDIVRCFRCGQVKKFVTYIHEFQHLLRDCGLQKLSNELEIV